MKDYAFDYSYWSHDGFITPDKEMGFLYPEPGSNYIDQNKVFNDLVGARLLLGSCFALPGQVIVGLTRCVAVGHGDA